MVNQRDRFDCGRTAKRHRNDCKERQERRIGDLLFQALSMILFGSFEIYLYLCRRYEDLCILFCE